jgi:DNA repair protein RecO (recombination protein O)
VSLLVTDAVVLHAFDYLESSRIVKLATRVAGIQSALAKGARRARGAQRLTLDLFVEGSAQLYVKPGRDLQTLGGFDLARSRAGLATDLGRFSAASAIAELLLRFGRDEHEPEWFDALVAALDGIESAPVPRVRIAALAGAWHIVAALGFAPSLDACARCHADIGPEDDAAFSHGAGGILCANCAAERGGRTLPSSARAALRAWTSGTELPEALVPDEASERAHVRLLRTFLREHLEDGRPLRAVETWATEAWAGG